MKTLTFVAKFDMGVRTINATSFFHELFKRNNTPSFVCENGEGEIITITLTPKEFCIKDGKNLVSKRKHNAN